MIFRLYKKTHKVTGLKYLGYTSSNDPQKYKGSGKYWRRHVDKHGYDVDTEILFETGNKEELRAKGLYYTKLWNVVESKEWANLKPESGNGGTFSHRSDSIEKIRDYQKNKKVWSEKALQNLKDIAVTSANNRRGQSWTETQRASRLKTYIDKNLEIASKIFPLADSGLNKLTIAKTLNISWDKVKYSLINREHFELRLKETL
jgi:hypothetical protein